MNLHLSDWEWLRVVTSLLFIWRGIQDLRDRSGTAWKTEDERKNFRKFSGVTLILGGAETSVSDGGTYGSEISCSIHRHAI